MNVFYVYCYFDGETPIYIGKGHGDRIRKHLQAYFLENHDTLLYRTLRKMLREGRKPVSRKLLESLSEEEAFYYECFFIAAIGRRDKGEGPLCNLTDGGEGQQGRQWTQNEYKKWQALRTYRIRTGQWGHYYYDKRDRLWRFTADRIHIGYDVTLSGVQAIQKAYCRAVLNGVAAEFIQQCKDRSRLVPRQIRLLRAGSILWSKRNQCWRIYYGKLHIGMALTFVEAEKIRVGYCKAVRDGVEEKFLQVQKNKPRNRRYTPGKCIARRGKRYRVRVSNNFVGTADTYEEALEMQAAAAERLGYTAR